MGLLFITGSPLINRLTYVLLFLNFEGLVNMEIFDAPKLLPMGVFGTGQLVTLVKNLRSMANNRHHASVRGKGRDNRPVKYLPIVTSVVGC